MLARYDSCIAPNTLSPACTPVAFISSGVIGVPRLDEILLRYEDVPVGAGERRLAVVEADDIDEANDAFDEMDVLLGLPYALMLP